MYVFGPIHWVIVAITLFLSLAVIAIPAGIVLRRAGYPPALALLAILPGAAIIGLWIFALVPWPALDERQNR